MDELRLLTHCDVRRLTSLSESTIRRLGVPLAHGSGAAV
jgi:hypothetical protein